MDDNRKFGPVALAAGLAGFLAVLAFATAVPQAARHALAVLVLMAVWWVTEAVPIHWTALVPLVAYPLFPIGSRGAAGTLLDTAVSYVDPNIFLFMGGMFLAVAMETHGLHRRIALNIMRLVGANRFVLGFLLATAFVSLWISNTATAVMTLPIGLAVYRELERRAGRSFPQLGQALMLAIAYGSNIGGIGTKIGTPPNAQFAGFMAKRFGVEVSFLDFMMIGLPFVVMFLPLAYFALWLLSRKEKPPDVAAEVLGSELAALGRMSVPEKRTAILFLLACALWICSRPLRGLVGYAGDLDPIIAMGVAALLFVTRVLGWASFRKMPWSVLVLLGGSFALAYSVKMSGLAAWGVQQLAGVGALPPLTALLLVSATTVLLTAFASNTATAQLMLELTATAFVQSRMGPLGLLSAVTLSASCDFALPAGTPPNAIVFGSGLVRLPVMAGTGVALDVLAAVMVALWCYYGLPHLF